MRNLGVLFFVMLIAGCLVLFLISFQVRETEVAIIATWGKPGEPITEPGWRFKWPTPIDTVYKYDSRPRVFAGVQEETTTRGGEPIIVNSYVLWKISDARKFLVAAGTYEKAEQLLLTELKNAQNSIVGEFYFNDFVNSEPGKIKLAVIEERMLKALNDSAVSTYGIEINTVGISNLKVPENVTENVFARMREDRNRKKEAIINEGQAEANRIQSEANEIRSKLLAAADMRAKSIRADGDAEAAKYYNMLEEDPDFAIFLRDLEGLKKILESKTTILLDQNSEPIKLLKGIPDITPKK